MTKTLDQLAASTTTADADLLLKRDNASGDDKKIREDDLQLSRSAVRQINVGGAADYTLTNGDAGRPLIELIGALTDNIDVIVPTSGRRYTFVNSTSGSFTITVKTSAGTGVLLPQGELRQVRCDGTNVITGDGFSDFTSMPEVNGDPIIEEGSNANGEFIKFASGRMIASVSALSATITMETAGNIFRSDATTTWTYPDAFLSAPAVAVTAQDGNTWVDVIGGQVNASSAGIRFWSFSGTPTDGSFNAIAVGSWK